MGKVSRECQCCGSTVKTQFTKRVTKVFCLFSVEHLLDRLYVCSSHKTIKGKCLSDLGCTEKVLLLLFTQ